MSAIEVKVTHGFTDAASELLTELIGAIVASTQARAGVADEPGSQPFPSTTVTNSAPTSEVGSSESSGGDKPAAVRERGKPAPGAKRRTSAEVAEDKAADEADAAAAKEPAANAAGAAAKEPAKSDGPDKIDFDNLRARLRDYHKANGPDAAKALFQGLTGESLQTVTETEYPTVSDRLTAALDDGPASGAGSSGGSGW